MLVADNIQLSYGKSIVFQDINLSVSRGESIAVVGKSGCGKTSLLYVLSGLRKPSAGRVYFEDQDLWQSENQRLSIRRRRFGFIFQQHFLINYLTALENILVPVFELTSGTKRALELLQMLDMEGLEHRFPYELSGGQRQRIAIGRALVNHPDIIFADEPTASLDRENAAATMRLLNGYRAASPTSLVMVTHDHRLVEGFDQLISLEK